MYLLEEDTKSRSPRATDGLGTILREVREAAKILREEFSVGADVWAITSFNELRRDGRSRRAQQPPPGPKPARTYVEKSAWRAGSVIASTDHMEAVC